MFMIALLICQKQAGGVRSPGLPAFPLNVLFIVSDDMRPQNSFAYDQQFMHTPAFDRLAREGITFSRAYSQIAVCAPSRSSLLTGSLLRKGADYHVWSRF